MTEQLPVAVSHLPVAPSQRPAGLDYAEWFENLKHKNQVRATCGCTAEVRMAAGLAAAGDHHYYPATSARAPALPLNPRCPAPCWALPADPRGGVLSCPPSSPRRQPGGRGRHPLLMTPPPGRGSRAECMSVCLCSPFILNNALNTTTLPPFPQPNCLFCNLHRAVNGLVGQWSVWSGAWDFGCAQCGTVLGAAQMCDCPPCAALVLHDSGELPAARKDWVVGAVAVD